jgi:hypothetical protein
MVYVGIICVSYDIHTLAMPAEEGILSIGEPYIRRVA